MKYFFILTTLLILIGTNSFLAQNNSNPWEKLSDKINNWVAADEDRTYHEDDLFDYIDGGAELFLSFGFNKVFNRIYSRPGQPDIYVDIFEMTSSYNAYGVFTLSTENPGEEFGQGSQYTQGAILFWKEKYFVSIITSPETPEAKEAIFEIASVIDKAIPVNGKLPSVLNYLPKENLDRSSIRYFRHHHWQNSQLYLAYENIFNIDQTVHCVSAKYDYEDNKVVLMLFDYTDAQTAQDGYNKFINDYIPGLAGKQFVQREDATYTGAKLYGKLLSMVFKAKSNRELNELLKHVENRIIN